MKKRTLIHIFLFLLLAATAASCGHLGPDDPVVPFELSNVQVSGAVYDRETGEPIMEAVVEFCAYDESDLEMSTPLMDAKTLSYLKGAYSFRVANPPSTKTWQLKASANGHKTAIMDLYIDTNTSSYDTYFKSFKVESVDFYLESVK